MNDKKNELKIQKIVFITLLPMYFLLGIGGEITRSKLLNSVAFDEILNLFSLFVTIHLLYFSYLILDKHFSHKTSKPVKIAWILVSTIIMKIFLLLIFAVGLLFTS
ncbi:hypothetical protein CUPS4256_03185, partial [Campylobacter upsaliensis]|uniref:hypothetical protein n=1 Tax=Campylobacter upsaliensis TaxID=28080 RepID=UPI00214A417A